MSAFLALRRNYCLSSSCLQIWGAFALVAIAFVLGAAPAAWAGDKWQTPTPEELSMTAQPQVPGAAAVVLYSEDISDDNLHMHSVYMRVKVLTESGKDYADIELPFFDQQVMSGISGRTIQPDGSVVNFDGKPYDKIILRNKTQKVQAKVFTLPAVSVGSILEYRYTWRYPDNALYAPEWYVQRTIFVRKAHYEWKPYDTSGGHYVIGADGKVARNISWAASLPEGAKVEARVLHGTGTPGSNYALNETTTYVLDVKDVLPLEEEEFTPPMHSISQRVVFYYTGANSAADFWRDAGNNWSKKDNSFIGNGKGAVAAEVARVTSGSDTQEAKLRKIYADVMSLDNTDYSRVKDKKEVKVAKSADDVLEQKAGSGDQLNLLFVAMARSAGMKAYAGIVANRHDRFFWPALFHFSQLTDSVAIVTVDGKEQYFDPAYGACPYGMLGWQNQATEGIRQTDSGSARFTTPTMPYTSSQMKRIADLTMAADGTVTGMVKFTWVGTTAMNWRQRYLRDDLTEVRRRLRDDIENVVPKGIHLELVTVDDIDQIEKPLVATFKAEGKLGEATGKRMLVPAQFFQTNATPIFSAADRKLPIDMEFGRRVADAVRIALPASMHWEAQPNPEGFTLKQDAQYRSSSDLAGNSLTLHRTVDIAQVFYRVSDYAELRDFFAKVATADATQALASVPPAKGGTGPAAGPQGGAPGE